MEFLLPRDRQEALELMAGRPGTVPVAGGTDVMVGWNMSRGLPARALDLSRLGHLSRRRYGEGRYRLGANTTYSTLTDELCDELPGVAAAAGAVGSRQIRNRGTLGGSLGSAWPAADAPPALLACRAEVELASVRGSRRVPVREFFVGPGRTAREGDELIEAVLLPRPEGPQLFTKVGRKAVATLATCSFAVALWPSTRQVLTGVGGADRPAPAAAAEAFLAGQLAAHGTWETGERLPDEVVRHFGELAAEGAVLGDDVRATAEYRRRALSVLARRSLAQAWENYRTERHGCA
ncbi:FAD binding domain-containing protein [Streptomyces albus]|uniref:FAD binding domain-containing protein n=1 Tax=Streptomyces albus TaxID=1888 RepID=UPI0006E46F04|nr:FAD binding domain-containing protein [Streptomyces albus]